MEQTPVSRLFKSWASPIVTGERISRAQADHSRPWTASQTVAGFFGRLRTAREIRLFRLFQSERRSTIWSRGGSCQTLCRRTDMNRKRILIADDEEMIRMLIRLVLGEDYDFCDAVDGEDAWQQIVSAEPPFDLMMLDLSMPRVGGEELLQRILAKDPTARVILLTGRLGYMAGSHRLVRVISKPFDNDDLAKQVKDLLNAS
jgi:CheY-like chemotaxis protein